MWASPLGSSQHGSWFPLRWESEREKAPKMEAYCSTTYNSLDMGEKNLNGHQQRNGWKRHGVCVYIYNGILLSHKKEWHRVICRAVNGPRDYHTKYRKSEREKQIPYINGYMWNLENGTDEFICKAEIETQKQRTNVWTPRQRRGEGGWTGRWDGRIYTIDIMYR